MSELRAVRGRPLGETDDQDLEAETARRINLLVARANLWRKDAARADADPAQVETAAS